MKFKDNTNPNILKAAQFTLQHQWWIDPEINQFNLLIDEGKDKMLNLIADSNITESERLSFYIEAVEDKTFTDRGIMVEKIAETGEKSTCWISRVDNGYVNILENTEKIKKLEFFGSKLKGVWIAKKSNESNTFWEMTKEK